MNHKKKQISKRPYYFEDKINNLATFLMLRVHIAIKFEYKVKEGDKTKKNFQSDDLFGRNVVKK